jgi:hypothetical protein
MGPLRPWLSLVLAGVLVLPACNGILDIDQTGIIVFEDVEASGPAAVPALVNGMVGNYQEVVDDVVRYSALLTDEMILSGTFETRLEVDRRRIQANNATLAGAMYTPLHQARMQADTTVDLLQKRLQDPAFEEVLDELNEGIALGKLYGGFSRIWLAELYCWSILTGMFPESSPLIPDDRMSQALTFLQQAETQAAMAGLEEIRLAAIAGQARAHLWLRNFPQAAALAAAVPRNFVHWAEFSQNDPAQYNEMYMFTWGDIQAIRWTVGDGTRPTRGNERWEHFDEFISLNLLEFEPEGFTAFSSVFPVSLQGLYSRANSRVLVASGAEAMLIRAEAAVRSGQTATAELLLNDLRSDYSLRATIQWGVDLPDAGDELVDLTLAGTFAQDLRTVAAERARELWLTGDRLTTSRRLRLDPTVNIDLFPPVKTRINGGDDIAFPMVQLELDNNPNLSSGDACPAGQTIGSWR